MSYYNDIAAFQKNTNDAIDDLREIVARLDCAVDQVRDELSNEIAHVEARTRKHNQCDIEILIDVLQDRISDLEEIIASSRTVERKPHKCPVCDGKCWIVVEWNGDKTRDHCVACKNNGILWS